MIQMSIKLDKLSLVCNFYIKITLIFFEPHTSYTFRQKWNSHYDKLKVST
jgi:hypothetical protein